MKYIVEIEPDQSSFEIYITSLKSGLKKELERYNYCIQENDNPPYHYIFEQPYQYYLQKHQEKQFLQYDELINLFKKYGYEIIGEI